MSKMASQHGSLLERLQRYASQHPLELLTVHLDCDRDNTSLEDILTLPFVASIVLARRDDRLAARYPDRVGWVDFAGGDYHYPKIVGDSLWRWNDNASLGTNTSRTFVRSGIKRFVYATPLFNTAITNLPLAEFIRCRLYQANTDLIFKKQLGQVGTRTMRLVDEYLWKHWLRSLSKAMPNRAPDAYQPSGILLITNSLGAGGSERQLVNTALGLSRKTSEKISILCLSPNLGPNNFHGWRVNGREIDIVEVPAIGAQPLDQSLDSAIARLWLDVGPGDGVVETLARLTSEFIDRRPRVVHAWLDSVNIPAGLAATLAGVPNVVLSARSVSPTHFGFLQPYMRPGYRSLLRNSTVRLLNNSEAGARDYTRWLRISQKLITVIRNGIDIDDIEKVTSEEANLYRHRIGLSKDSPVIGSVFRFGEEKRPLLWARIAALVARERSDVQFLMIGDGPLRNEVRAYSEREGFSDRLFMPGSEPNSAIPIATMTCLLLTSRVEGLPNVLLEAQAAGVPVVTSHVGGASEATDNGRCGWVIAGENPVPYAERIIAILDDLQWRENVARLGPELVAARFGLDQMLCKTLRIYDSHGCESGPPQRERVSKRSMTSNNT